MDKITLNLSTNHQYFTVFVIALSKVYGGTTELVKKLSLELPSVEQGTII